MEASRKDERKEHDRKTWPVRRERVAALLCHMKLTIIRRQPCGVKLKDRHRN